MIVNSVLLDMDRAIRWRAFTSATTRMSRTA